MLSKRDFVQIGDASRLFGVSEQTLRNWDRAGKLRAHRHPINGYRLYRVADLKGLLESATPGEVSEPKSGSYGVPQLELPIGNSRDADLPASRLEELPPCHWSLSVALDPKHRPQLWSAPSSTVRRDWRKYPQEAHVLDSTETKYRRMTPPEICLLQGISPTVFDGLELTDREKIAAVGDAVPPPLSRALFTAIVDTVAPSKSDLEICAGIGGLATGAASVGLQHLALVEYSPSCELLLKNRRHWSASVVHRTDARTFDYAKYKDKVGVLSGGPPCQPWSASGQRRGVADERDLLGHLPEIITAIRPETFIFENVPGLTVEKNRPYLEWLVRRLRSPGGGLEYAVQVGEFDAVNFGVPQHRRRIFIVGARDVPHKVVNTIFNRVEELSSHGDPTKPLNGKTPWMTVGDILSEREDPGGWRRWITS